MREITGNSIGSEVVNAPGPARVRESVEGMNMLALLVMVGVAVGFSDLNVGGTNT